MFHIIIYCVLADSSDATNGTKPSVYLYDDPVSGPQVMRKFEPKLDYCHEYTMVTTKSYFTQDNSTACNELSCLQKSHGGNIKIS